MTEIEKAERSAREVLARSGQHVIVNDAVLQSFSLPLAG
jgi:hypothetical protein